MREHIEDSLELKFMSWWQVPTLLRFREKNEYKSDKDPALHTHRRDGVLYSLVKVLWHHKRMKTLLAMREGKIIGYLTVVFGRNKVFRGNAYVVSLAVERGERSRGVGTALMQKLEEYALEQGTRRVEFEVFSSNERAVQFYQRLGYEVEGCKRRAVENKDGFDDLLLMAKLLS